MAFEYTTIVETINLDVAEASAVRGGKRIIARKDDRSRTEAVIPAIGRRLLPTEWAAVEVSRWKRPKRSASESRHGKPRAAVNERVRGTKRLVRAW